MGEQMALWVEVSEGHVGFILSNLLGKKVEMFGRNVYHAL